MPAFDTGASAHAEGSAGPDVGTRSSSLALARPSRRRDGSGPLSACAAPALVGEGLGSHGLSSNGKRRELGLGGYPGGQPGAGGSGLARSIDVRQRWTARIRRSTGVRHRPRFLARRARPVTFAQAAEAYISVHAAGWKHPLQAASVAPLARAACLPEDRPARRPGRSASPRSSTCWSRSGSPRPRRRRRCAAGSS